MTDFSPEDYAAMRATLGSVQNSAKGDIKVDPYAALNHKIGLVVKEKQKLGWNSRRIRRYIKLNFDLNISLN
jgi:hypothetical protein